MRKQNIALVIISTGLYDRFIEPLLNSARVHFMPQDSVIFHIFTDKIKDYGEDTVIIPTKHENWPGPTLHRYRNIVASKNLFSGMDYIFYSDVDMLFMDTVGREILGEGLTAVLHPGFAMFPGKGSWSKDHKSTAYTPSGKRYYAGGFQGGNTKEYLQACEKMASNIKADELAGVLAEWHDESHWNKLLSYTNHHDLTPDYCMVEQPNLRRKWMIDNLRPKLIALAKNHAEIRS